MILITGAAGYIGSETARSLVRAGFSVVGIDNLSTGIQESFPLEASFHVGDVRDEAFLNKIFDQYKFKAVLHFAAKIVVSESFRASVDYYDNNVNGLITLLSVCRIHSVKKIIFSSSSTVYGNAKLGGNLNQILSEAHQAAPMSPYGFSKLFGEQILQDAASDFGLNSLCLRYFNVAGASLDLENGQRRKDPSHIIHVASLASLKKDPEITIYGNDYATIDGTCVRDYIHVSDIAEIHCHALRYLLEVKESHILNCASGQGYSVKQVIDVFNQVNQVKIKINYAPRRQGDPALLIGDSSKLSEIIGWSKQINDLETICMSAYQWQNKLNG